MHVNTAIVLAGGAGLRLRPHTIDKPKGMVNVCGKPLLEWIMEWLSWNGITDVVLGVAYKKQTVMKYFKNGERYGLRIKYSVHSVEGGTAEGFHLAINRHADLNDLLVCMNGDELVDLSLSKMESFHFRHDSIATIAVSPMKSPYGIVKVRKRTGEIQDFLEKPKIPNAFVNIGIYLFGKEAFSKIPRRGDIERTTFPYLVERRQIRAYIHRGFWRTIDTDKDLHEVEEELRKRSFGFQARN